MDFETECCFEELDNSLLVAALLTKEKQKEFKLGCRTPIDQLTNNLGMISALYIYTNTPPHGYGSQGPKVAETVKRAYGYNKKKKNKVLEINGYNIERLNWEDEDGPFPMDEIHGNFLPFEAKKMAMKFLKDNVSLIDSCVEKTMEHMLHTNSDILTKGRQTLNCFTHQSVTASVAYKRMYDFFHETFGCGTISCLEWIRYFFLCLNKDNLTVTEIKETSYITEKYDRNLKMRITKEKKTSKMVKRTLPKEECRAKMMDYARSFASYLKHKERGKLQRRAIASANMILRMFLLIIEDFHLALGKTIQGSTISVGGEEKKAKIINNLADVNIPQSTTIMEVQGTEDATKWNECLSPAVFAMMHKVFFDDQVRQYLSLPKTSEYGHIFREIALSAHLIMSIKRIQMGVGPIAESELYYNRLDWLQTPLDRFNTNTREWLEEIRPNIDKDNYLMASPGMLMGMLNAGSTTLGLIATGYAMDPSQMQAKTLRSSDDSTTIYVGIDRDTLIRCIEINRRALAAIGINLSLEKTFFFEKYYSEYTSWYQDQGFVSQFGVETSAIRPQGKNPPDDFYSVAKGTATSLSTLTVNHIGATMRLTLGIDGVRRIWRIKRNPEKREGISRDVLLLTDGGINPWDSCNCHLEETSLREKFIKTREDKEYLLKVTNPNNPFAPEPMEDVTYSKESGRLVTTEVDTPRTIFHYMKRSNRTVNNSLKEQMFNKEKIHSEVTKIVKTVIPTTIIKYPNESVPMYRQILAALSIMRSEVSLNEQEELDFQFCIKRLQGEVTSGEQDAEIEDIEHLFD